MAVLKEAQTFDFDSDVSVAEFAVPKRSYLNAHPDAPFGYI
jgi:hypothetical protein